MTLPFELVGPEAVDSALSRSAEPGCVAVLEAHFSSLDHPLQGDMPVRRHIPGAIQVHPSYLEAGVDESSYYPFYQCPQDGNLMPHAQLVDALERLGITPETTVIVYGTEPDGPMAAARLVWGLLVAGVKSVQMLDGGIDAWLAHGGQSVSSIQRAVRVAEHEPAPDPQPAPDPGRSGPWTERAYLVADTAEVKEISRAPGRSAAKLVDIRKSGEFDGSLTHCYSFFSKSGHIPGATLQGDWVSLVDEQSQKIAPALESVRQRWRKLGIIDARVESGETCLVLYCGTGWRSSVSFLVATLLGYKAKNYDDGFYGWSWDGSNEIEYTATQ